MSALAGSRLLLVEGVPGLGKSTLLDRLLRMYVAREAEGQLRTVISLAQTHTYGPIAAAEDDGTLTAAQNLAHLDRVVGPGVARPSCARADAHETFVLVDTRHLTALPAARSPVMADGEGDRRSSCDHRL